MHGVRARVGVNASARYLISQTMGSWYCGNDKEDYLDTCDPLCLALNNGVTYGDGIIRVRTWHNESKIIQAGMTGKCIALIHIKYMYVELG